MTQVTLIGAPVDCGKARRGCLMGPDAFRVAGLAAALEGLGHSVRDAGNVIPGAASEHPGAPAHIQHLGETVAWTKALQAAARDAMKDSMPIFLGGDHALAMGTVTGVAAHAAAQGRQQFVLWLDAHTDFHTMETSTSGNLHGTPVAYATGRAGFDPFPKVEAPVPDANICMIGIRSVDPAEYSALIDTDVSVYDMRQIDETGMAAPLREFLEKVEAANGMLHVSLDVDFLDPAIAPAVGTTVPGGATFREAHLVMEMLHESGLVTSLDLVELNPFLDERGRTAQLMVDLTGSLMGRKVFDRPNRPFHQGYAR
ncbi:arginase [Oceaniglobus roseus]|uniref:arginase n=1 Tax=Oceaniglobus roseus TaxID=1737570 RepID=UPI000C7F6EC1|nr:arginase [Kandeliimicrobium roseum]